MNNMNTADSYSGDFTSALQPVPRQSRLLDPGYIVWGASMVDDDRGQYHLFYSRWPEATGFQSWVTHSEIAHAVATDPLGPYRPVDVALPARGDGFWDGHCTHNPTVRRYGDRYYLYYIGNYGDRIIPPTDKPNLNWVHRNNQRIGVAVADNPEGPWTRMNEPIIDVSPEPEASDALCVTNPSMMKGPDDVYRLVYKAVGRAEPLPFGGPVVHRLAVSDHPCGPFQKYPKDILQFERSASDGGAVAYRAGEALKEPSRKAHFPAEDPFAWFDASRGMYCVLLKVMQGNQKGTLSLFVSPDAIQWEPANPSVVTRPVLRWADGEQQELRKLERPQIWFQDGRPSILFAAAMDMDGHTFNAHIPLQRI